MSKKYSMFLIIGGFFSIIEIIGVLTLNPILMMIGAVSFINAIVFIFYVICNMMR